MNYSAVIQDRKSVRAYTNKKVTDSEKYAIVSYYQNECMKLIPDIHTKLLIFDSDAGEKLEGAAGYKDFMIGASAYMVLLSEEKDFYGVNAGFIMEDLVLKLTDMGLATCWITFADSNKIKDALKIDSGMTVAAICAFGHGAKAIKSLKLNILSMSNIDVKAKREFFDPKKSVYDMVYLDAPGNEEGRDEYVDSYGDMLWEAFFSVSLSPSYLNRQPYCFVIHDGNIIFLSMDDTYTDEIDKNLGLGIALLHFSGSVSSWAGKIEWKLGSDAAQIEVPEGYQIIASCKL